MTPHEELELIAIEKERRKRAASAPKESRSLGRSLMDAMEATSGKSMKEDYYPTPTREGAAAASRGAGMVAGLPGGPLGVATNGLGTSVAQLIEGKPNFREILLNSSLGFLPMSPARGLLSLGNVANATKVGLTSGIVNKTSNLLGLDNKPDELAEAGVLSGATLASPLVGRVAGKIMGHVNPKDAVRVAETLDEGATKLSRQQLAAAREYSITGKNNEVRRLTIDPSVPAVRNEDDLLLKMAGGKTAMAQEAAKRNVPVYQGMGQQDLRLPQNGEGITLAQIKDKREGFYAPYEKIRQIATQAKGHLDKLKIEMFGHAGPPQGSAADLARRAEIEASPEYQRMAGPLETQAAADVDGLRRVRGEASKAFNRYKSSEGKDPAALDEYWAKKAEADLIEDKIDDAGRLSDDPELLENLKKARADIAQTHVYEDAIGSDGIINPQTLNLMLDAGLPLKGNALKIAEVAKVARGNATELSRIGDPNANAATGLVGGVGAVTNPEKAAWYAAIPYVRNIARKRLLSEKGQNSLINPKTRTPSTSADPAVNAEMARIAALIASRAERDDLAAKVRDAEMKQALRGR